MCSEIRPEKFYGGARVTLGDDGSSKNDDSVDDPTYATREGYSDTDDDLDQPGAQGESKAGGDTGGAEVSGNSDGAR